MVRAVAGWFGLVALVSSCAPGAPATSTTANAPADRQSEAAGGGSALPAEPATPSPNAPTFDEEMACRRKHCYPKESNHCFETCYKYNHPRDPETHTRCNDSCRRNWDMDDCEQACAVDRRAFAEVGTNSGRCHSELKSCRASCSSKRSPCELECLRRLATCERTDERAE